jgi:putative membrane protein
VTLATAAAGANGWTLDPGQLAGPLVLALAYAVRVRGLARKRRAPGRVRRLAFYAGVAVLVLAVSSPIDTVGEHRLFFVHMIQHLMLGDIAPLLIVIGLTGPVLRPLVATPVVRRMRLLSHPLVALPIWAVNLCVWHLATLYEGAIRSAPVHAVEHALFFTSGALVWAAVVEPLPGPEWFSAGWKSAYTLAVRTVQAGLANVFLWSSVAFYGVYAAGERSAGLTPAQDQAIAGGIMLVEGAVVTVVVFAWAFLRWTSESEVTQRLVESGHDHARSARAARYGRSPIERRAPR